MGMSKEQFLANESFVQDAKDYIAAVREGRILFDVTSVARSGASRTILIRACEPRHHLPEDPQVWCYRNYTWFFEKLGYKTARNCWDGIIVKGGGMSMTFHVNYEAMHLFAELGFITKEERDVLTQRVN